MNTNRIFIVIAVVMGGVLAGGWVWLSGGAMSGSYVNRFASCQTSTVAGGSAVLGGSFDLVNGDGVTVTDTDIITKPTILYFGYTYCPDVCPLDNSRNAEVLDLLSKNKIDAQAVFITVDPKRDTPKVMADYTANMHEKMIGLTGSAEQIATAAKNWRVAYQVQDDGTDDYLVGHTTLSYLVLPKYGTVEFFHRGVTPEAMAKQIACFVDKS